jgi:hypothetical protein
MKTSGLVVHHLCRSVFALGFIFILGEKSFAFDGEISLEKMRSMHYSGPTPELGVLSPATQIDLTAPKDSDYHTAAYRNNKDCVIFFFPMDKKTTHDLTFSWRGAACNGTPVSGAGDLEVQYKVDTSDGTKTYVKIFNGTFSGGLLSGHGKKINLQFDAQGKRQPDTCEFNGQFAYGLLDGVGTRTCYDSESAQPKLKVISGNFKKGETAEGKAVISMLHPYPGAEAISQEVIYSDSGDEKYYTYPMYANKKRK